MEVDPTSDNFEKREPVNDRQLQQRILDQLIGNPLASVGGLYVGRVRTEGLIALDEKMYRVVEVTGGHFIYEILEFIG